MIEPKSVNSLNDKSLNERVGSGGGGGGTAVAATAALPRIRMEDCISNNNNNNECQSTTRINGLKKLLMMLEPTGCMKERDDFSLYIFASNNR